jgi:hypothetical protein
LRDGSNAFLALTSTSIAFSEARNCQVSDTGEPLVNQQSSTGKLVSGR